MKLRKLMAGTLAATMVLGSSMTVFAEDQTGTATGTGTSVGHVDKEVLTVTLPTDTANVFNYWIDPERVIDLAGSLADGTSVTANADGVYFKQSDNTYASTSNDVEFEGKNSVAVDVSVTAAVTSGTNDITLVADENALTAATTPALLMKLTVGTDTKAITSEGATAKAELAGVPGNFEVKVDNGAYVYSAKTGATGWAKTAVKLSGKTNNMEITSNTTAPTIALTWTIEKHVDSYLSATTLTASSPSVTLTLPEDVEVSSVALTLTDGTGSAALTNGSQYTLVGTTFTVSADNIAAWVGANYTKIVLTFSDGKSETITLQ